MIKQPLPHQTLLGSSAALALLRARGPAAIVVACGQYSPDPAQAERTLFFEPRGNRLITILDAWLAPEARQEVLAALQDSACVATGSCSATYAAGAEVVWADCGEELRLWQHGLLVARFGPHATWVRQWLVGPWKEYSNARFSLAHGYLSRSWLRRGVRLCADGRRALPIAWIFDPVVLFDPTYDGTDLASDASWVRSLATAISDVTAIPIKLDSPLA
jgi:hypothetical protein